MSLTTLSIPEIGIRRPLTLRLGLAVLAVACAGLLLGVLAWTLVPGIAVPPPRSPFGVGFREAAPVGSGIGEWLLAVQSRFSKSLEAALAAIKTGGAWGPLIGLGFAYGTFHAAGPGHGKAVIAGYIVAGERTLLRGFSLSFAAAFLQACVAILIVGIGAWILNATATGMTRAGTMIETASFVLVALVGGTLTWRKAGTLAERAGGREPAACGADCGHRHLADADRIARLATWRERAGIVAAAGTRPCAGAVLILVFALSQGLFAAGIAATFAMALGTALTTGALASLAVFAKGLALRLAGGRGTAGVLALGAVELIAAAFVLVLGVALLLGLARGVAG